MKNRTIEELHDKDIGHRKFAMICDLLIRENHDVSDIKEYNEKFKFKVDGYNFEYQKEWKCSARAFAEYLLDILKMNKELGGF